MCAALWDRAPGYPIPTGTPPLCDLLPFEIYNDAKKMYKTSRVSQPDKG